MVGYNNTDHRVDAVNLKDITSIKLAVKHKNPKAEMVNEWIAGIVPSDHVPSERKEVLYKGLAVFKCRGQYITELFYRFGAPAGAVEKNCRCRATCPVQDITLTVADLNWLSQIPEYGIRIIGPDPLVEAVADYYSKSIAC